MPESPSHAIDDAHAEPAGDIEECPGSRQPVGITFAGAEHPAIVLGPCDQCPHHVLVDERCVALPHDTQGRVLTHQCRR